MKFKLILLILVIYCSCSKNENSLKKEVSAEYEIHAESPPPPPPPPSNSISDGNEKTQSKLIKTGKLKIVSKDIETTKTKLNNILKICKGTITYESLSKNEDEASYSLLYNVPVYNFDKFINLIDSLDLNITEKVYKVTDVTLRYIDETSRLNNKRKLEKTYLDILAKTTKIEDVLEVQKNIEEIRADIESKEAQLKSLDNQIAFSEFDIKIEKTQVNKTNKSNSNTDNYEKFTDALGAGLNGIIESFVFLLTIWPIYILITLLFLVYRYFRKKHKK